MLEIKNLTFEKLVFHFIFLTERGADFNVIRLFTYLPCLCEPQCNATQLCLQWTTSSSPRTRRQQRPSRLWSALTASRCTPVTVLKFR